MFALVRSDCQQSLGCHACGRDKDRNMIHNHLATNTVGLSNELQPVGTEHIAFFVYSGSLRSLIHTDLLRCYLTYAKLPIEIIAVLLKSSGNQSMTNLQVLIS